MSLPAAIKTKLERLKAHGRASVEFRTQWQQFQPAYESATRRGNRSLQELALVALDKLLDEEFVRKGLD